MANPINLVGKTYGRWKVLRKSEFIKPAGAVWVCECECGTVRDIPGGNLRWGKSKSCGCMAHDVSGPNRKHGMFGTKFYTAWNSMRSRCKNVKNKSYPHYGGRGITVCDRWTLFENFRDDLYEKYIEHSEKHGERNTTLERVDVNGNYEPSNVTWATMAEQARNKRKPISRTLE